MSNLRIRLQKATRLVGRNQHISQITNTTTIARVVWLIIASTNQLAYTGLQYCVGNTTGIFLFMIGMSSLLPKSVYREDDVNYFSLRSLFVHTVGRLTLSVSHSARSFRMRISQITYSHFRISQITNAYNH